MRKSILFLFSCLIALFTFQFAFADSAPVVLQPADFLAQVLEFIKAFGGLPWIGKISGISLLVIASMKVSFMQPFWKKLGAAQVFIGPILGIVAGLASMNHFSWAALSAYLFAGAGAIMLHEILDAIKAVPGIGSVYVSVINFFEGLLGGGQPPASK